MQGSPVGLSIGSLILAFFWPCGGDSRRKEGRKEMRERERGYFLQRGIWQLLRWTMEGYRRPSHPFILRFWKGASLDLSLLCPVMAIHLWFKSILICYNLDILSWGGNPVKRIWCLLAQSVQLLSFFSWCLHHLQMHLMISSNSVCGHNPILSGIT